MKFIHTADLHLDSKVEKLSADKSKIIREETIYAFERLVDYADKNEVKAIIIAGDLFDGAKAYLKTLNRLVQIIGVHPDIDFICIYGNHDLNNNFISTVQFPFNFKLVGQNWASFEYENVCISAISVSTKNADYFADTLCVAPDKFNIVTVHTGYNDKDKAVMMNLNVFKDRNIDYLAMGHVHQYSISELDRRCKCCYSGCLQGRGFDETGEKGFVLIDTDGVKADYHFIPFSKYNYYSVEYSVDGVKNFYELKQEIIDDLTDKYDKNSLIKVILKGNRSAHFDVDKDSLTLRLNELFFFAKVYDQTKMQISLEDYIEDKSVRGEFVKLVLSSNLTDEQKQKVINCGLDALKGEKI